MAQAKSTPRARSHAARSVEVSVSAATDPTGLSPFDIHQFLDSSGVARRIVEYRRAEVIFRQGDPCDSVLYVKEGGVKISVLAKTGKQAVVAMLGPGDFLGQEGLAGQPVRMGSASAITGTTILIVEQLVSCP